MSQNAFGILNPPMPQYFRRTFTTDDMQSWKFNKTFILDAVIIYLGSNDYNTLLHPKSDEFLEAYENMINMIINNYYIY